MRTPSTFKRIQLKWTTTYFFPDRQQPVKNLFGLCWLLVWRHLLNDPKPSGVHTGHVLIFLVSNETALKEKVIKKSSACKMISATRQNIMENRWSPRKTGLKTRQPNVNTKSRLILQFCVWTVKKLNNWPPKFLFYQLNSSCFDWFSF